MCPKAYMYILRCSDNTLYTGYTTDVQRRVKEHNSSVKGAKYTSKRRPCILQYYEEFDSKSLAMKREYEVKHMSRKQKECLIRYGSGVRVK